MSILEHARSVLLAALLASPLAAQMGTCGPCPAVGSCPPTHPLTTGSFHACEDHAGHDHSHSQLPQIDLSFADLTGADLSSTIVPNASLRSALLAGANLAHSDLSSADVSFADLSGVDLFQARVANADMRFADLSNATGLATVHGAPLYNCHTSFEGTGFDPAASGWSFSPCPSFEADRPALSASAGGTQRLFLDAGAAQGGDVYLIVGSAGGTSPGTPVGGFLLPLNTPDLYFDFTLGNPNSPFLPSSLGVLSETGTAAAAFLLPAGSSPTLAGKTVHHAFAVLGTIGLEFISTPVALAFTA